MSNEVMEFVNAILSVAVAVLCLCLSKYREKRNQEYSKKYAGNVNWLMRRLELSNVLKYISLVMLWGMITKVLDTFITFYIFTPTLIALTLILFDSTDWMWGFMTFVKGLYYFGLIITSTVQYLLKSAEATMLALGFTLSLAIFETITALSDGYKKMQDAKQQPNRQKAKK